MALTQYNVKRVMQIFGKEKVETVVNLEMKQLYNMDGITLTSTLAYEEKCSSIMYLMHLRKKKGGVIKGRSCADGRK